MGFSCCLLAHHHVLQMTAGRLLIVHLADADVYLAAPLAGQDGLQHVQWDTPSSCTASQRQAAGRFSVALQHSKDGTASDGMCSSITI